jgi:hypothetical protein
LDTKPLLGQFYELCSNDYDVKYKYDKNALEKAVNNLRDSSCRTFAKFVEPYLLSSHVVFKNVKIKKCKS